MRCSKCGAENPDRAKFCVECASPFTRRCPSCNAENPSAAKFCLECAKPLEGKTAPAPSASSRRQHGGGERRHLTVLFSDLVNSTEIAAHLDPEEWREILAWYHRATGDAVARFGGHVAQYLGDGVMAFFGYPQAHDDDAERAVRAGLAILEAISETSRAPGGHHKVELAVRVGIHTGQVVTEEGDQGINAFGDVPNIASRVQTAAASNTILITASVLQLVSGLFVVEDRGTQTLKGVPEPLPLYCVLGSSGVRGRLRTSVSRGLTPFVGREDEMRLLLGRWGRAQESEGQLALVVGEPGIGKSRLVEEFRARIKDDRHLWIECEGEQLSANTPFHAIVQILDQGLGWHGDESQEERVVQLERSLDLTGLKLGEAVPLIAEMLNLPIPTKYPPLMFAPDQKRRRLMANLAAWVLHAARLQPVVIVLEDLHWVDPSTLELMQTLVEQAVTASLLLLCTARPEFRLPWPMRAHHVQITLNRLNPSETREVVTRVVASIALPKDVLDTVVERTGGVPLFAEELTRSVLEGGTAKTVHTIPATLQQSLMARLDRLGPAKDVAQVASVIGREFSYELLHAVSSTAEDELQSALTRLGEAELIYARGIPPEAIYQFKHALVQDAAYEALLKSRRRELHRRIANLITERFRQAATEQPEVLAHHWSGAGELEEALSAWTRAGRSARKRRAFREAERSYRRALEVINKLPESPERDALELPVAAALAQVAELTHGYSAAETKDALSRSRALLRRGGNVAQLTLTLSGAWAGAINSGDYRSADALSREFIELAEREGNPMNLAFAHMTRIETHFYLGELAEAESRFMRGRAFFDEQGFKQFPGAFGTALAFAGLTAFTSGRLETALTRINEAAKAARQRNNPYDLAFISFQSGSFKMLVGEPAEAKAAARQAINLSDEHGFPHIAAAARTTLGAAVAHCGEAAQGVQLIEESLSAAAKIETGMGVTLSLWYLAQAQSLHGETDKALYTIERALEANPDERIYRPEALRLRGELRLRAADRELAAEDFREAIVCARGMGAKSFELRATTSLARLLGNNNRRDEARVMLADIYNWFTEGFDTADLKDAKALLEELNERQDESASS